MITFALLSVFGLFVALGTISVSIVYGLVLLARFIKIEWTFIYPTLVIILGWVTTYHILGGN